MASLGDYEESQALPYTCVIETFPSNDPATSLRASPDLNPTKTKSPDHTYPSDPPTNNTLKNLSSNRKRNYHKFLSLLLFGLCLVMAITGTAILAIIAFTSNYNSKALPQPHLQVFAVSFCLFNISSSHVTAKWDWDLALENQYKADFYYSRFDLHLFYKTTFLSATSLNPFVQPGGNQTVVRANFGANSVYVEDTLMNDMFEDWNSGVVKFDVKMNIHIWTRSRWSNLKEIDMGIACEDVMVGFSSRNNSIGNLVGGPRVCKS